MTRPAAFLLSLFLCLLITALGLIPRLTHREVPLGTDEADYYAAVEKGLHANYHDIERTGKLRHYHPPLFIYLQKFTADLAGNSEAALRLFSLIAGLGTGILVFFGIGSFSVFRTTAPRLAAACIGAGLIVAFPPCIMHSKVAGPHAFTLFLLVAFVFSTAHSITSQRCGLMAVTGVLLGMLFATSEYFYPALCAFIACVLAVPNHWVTINRHRISFRWCAVGIVPAVIITGGLLWIAGFTRFGSLYGLLYYLHWAREGHPVLFMGKTVMHVPKWAYVVWFWKDGYPCYLPAIGAGAVFGVRALLKREWNGQVRIVALFALVFSITTLTQHMIAPEYSIYAGALLLILFATLVGRLWSSTGWVVKAALVLFTIATVVQGLRVGHGLRAGTTGYREAAGIIEENIARDEKVLAFYGNILLHYAPDVAVTNYPFGYTSEELFQQMKEGRFRYVLFYSSQLVRWPGDPAYRWARDRLPLVFSSEEGRERLFLFEYEEVRSTASKRSTEQPSQREGEKDRAR
jgi:4-amino-4-deoxy-L-arabinose transferase-like glycosyltransferase